MPVTGAERAKNIETTEVSVQIGINTKLNA